MEHLGDRTERPMSMASYPLSGSKGDIKESDSRLKFKEIDMIGPM